MSANVSIVPCGDYSPERVEAALREAIDAVGGLGWVEPGMTVAVKTNLIQRLAPETAAVTHPECLAALTRILRGLGARVVVGDSSGGPFTAAWIHAVYSGTGMEAVIKSGGELNEDFSTMEAVFPEGRTIKRFPYTAWLSRADAIIDFAKLKTHGMANMTCAVKNFFGSIPGTRKPEMHYLHQSLEDFCSQLVDLALYNAPRLTLVDAVECMEGNGPSHGTPRHMGALIAADTPFNADLLCAHLINLESSDVQTVAESIRRGLCPADWRELEIYGEPERFFIADFEHVPRSRNINFSSQSPWLRAFLRRGFGTGPRVNRSMCVGCGKCAEVCPAKAAQVVKNKAKIDEKLCIRCFCCQEFCPRGAITVHRPLLARIVGK